MRKRIFIAVGLPDETRAKIAGAVKRWQWLPIRWLKPENWHITVIPPFYAEEGELERVKEAAAEAAASLRPFSLSFRSIILAPPGKKARMVWLYGKASSGLQGLKEALEEKISEEKMIPGFTKEGRQVLSHVTLARFEEGALQQIEAKTSVLEELPMGFEVRELAVMESRLKATGAEYNTLARIPLGTGAGTG